MICQIFTTILVIKFIFLFIILVFVIFFMCTKNALTRLSCPYFTTSLSLLELPSRKPARCSNFIVYFWIRKMGLLRNIFLNISVNNTTNIPSGFHFQNQKSGIFKDFIRVCVFAGKSA